MPINQQTILNATLGKWRGRGYTLEFQEDTVDPNDHLVVIKFKGSDVATYYRSKLTIGNISVIQFACQRHWDMLMGNIKNDK